MGFKPSKELLHKAQARRDSRVEFHASQLTRKLSVEQRYIGTSKRAAKKDKQSLQKARAWRMKGTFEVPSSRVRLSRLEWI